MTNKQHIKLIKGANGCLLDNLVLFPGVMITQITKPTEEFKKLSDLMNIDTDRPDYEQHGEFNSRITYMSFKEEVNDSKTYNEKMVNEHYHLSVYNDHHITFLLAGISLEASLEIIAHNEATVARLTSSKTKAQSNPLFVSDGSPKQMKYYNEMSNSRAKNTTGDLENDNMMFPASKAISMTVTMSLKNWHKTLIGRLSDKGVEEEVIRVMILIRNQLFEKYPLIIKGQREYFNMNNGNKY